ncbi:SDR family NAD(P)-dependent oxidoreductase, partial [Acinetobacter baumannii]
QLARDGCHLALADRNEAALAQTLHLVRAHEGDRIRVTTHAVDVADRAAVYRWAEEANAVHGKVNLIFNNAGVALSST